MSEPNSRVDRFLLRLKRRPLVASLLALGTVVIALSTFTDAAKNLLDLIKRQSPEEARVELSRLSLDYSPATFLDKAQAGDLIAVRLFLAAGIDPNVSDVRILREGKTALDLAASEGHVAVVEALLEANADVNYRYGAWNGRGTALEAGAYHSGDANVLRVLIEAGADRESIRDAAHAAARGGNLEALRFLLEQIPEVAVTRDDDDDALLIDAAEGGSTDVVKLVLDRGAPVNEKGPGGLTPLHVAAENGYDAVVRVLLDSGAEVNSRDDSGMVPLHEAAAKGRDGVVRILLDAGADVDVRCECPDHYGGAATPLMMASQDGRNEAVRILLQGAADANIASGEGWTALLLAADNCGMAGDVEIVQLLLDNGADANARLSGSGVTPLMRAQRLPCVGTTRGLLEKGADVNAKDKDDWTPLMYAVQFRSVEAVRVLLESGARPNDRTAEGMTPLEWAEGNLTGELKAEMAQLLRSAGAQ